jgi:hypothetical protein
VREAAAPAAPIGEDGLDPLHVVAELARVDAGDGARPFGDAIEAEQVDEGPGEISPGEDGERERAPESAVDLHQPVAAARGVDAELHHGDAVPAEAAHQPGGGVQERARRVDRAPIRARPAAQRYLVDPIVREGEDDLAVPGQDLDAHPPSGHPALDLDRHEREELPRERGELAPVVRETDRVRLARRTVPHLGPRALDDDRRLPEPFVDDRRVEILGALDQDRLGSRHPERHGQAPGRFLVEGLLHRGGGGDRQPPGEIRILADLVEWDQRLFGGGEDEIKPLAPLLLDHPGLESGLVHEGGGVDGARARVARGERRGVR